MVVDTDSLFCGNGCSHRLYLAEMVFRLAIGNIGDNWQILISYLITTQFALFLFCFFFPFDFLQYQQHWDKEGLLFCNTKIKNVVVNLETSYVDV